MDLIKKFLMAVVAIGIYAVIIYVGHGWQEEQIAKDKQAAIEQVRDSYMQSLEKLPVPNRTKTETVRPEAAKTPAP